jgi:ADP-heptose:LPS heptosyltransferase
MKIKFLIIRFSSIGDIVLTSPVVRCLKNQVDNAEIHFVTKEKYVHVVAPNPFIHKIHILRENFNDLIAELKSEQFDYIIDLHQNFRSNRIKGILKIPSFTFDKLNIQKFLFVNFKINHLPDKHIVDRYMDSLSVFDVKNDEEGLDFFIPENDKFINIELPDEFRNGFVAFVIAGTYNTKKLPQEKIIEICDALKYPVILLGGKSENRIGEEILSESKGNIINFAGKINLNQSASLINSANVVLTNDTGLMHIAAAFKKKILSFWGNTVPEFGMNPYKPHPASKIMEVENLKCRPCSKLGYNKCPKKHFKCMKEIDVHKVVEWVNQNFE